MHATTPTPAPTLTELFRAWQAGSRRSGDRFFRAVRGRLQGYARSLASDDGGDDLLQDVFLTFLQHAAGFDTSGGDGAIVTWFKVTLRRRHWAMSNRASREIPVADAAERAELADDQAMAPVEARMQAASRVAAIRGAAAPRSGIRFHGATRERITVLADHLEAVLVHGDECVTSSGALAAKVGWTPFQLWQMSHRLEEAVAPRPVLVTTGPVSVPSCGAELPVALSATADAGDRESTRAPALSAAHRASAPEAVTSGCYRESMRVELGAGARTPIHRRGSSAAGQSRRAPPAVRAVSRVRRAARDGCRDGPPIPDVRESAFIDSALRHQHGHACM